MDAISYVKAKTALLNSLNINTKPFDFVDSGNYLFSPTSVTQNQAGYASVIRMDNKLSAPINKFYMYWAGHDGGGIRLSTAPSPLGPWSFYPDANTALITDTFFDTQIGGTTGHLSSPCIAYDETVSTFYLYFHRLYGSPNRQSTWRAESTDGITFSNPIEVLPCPLNGTWDGVERTYLRVIRYQGKWFGVYQGRNGGSDPHAHIGFVISDDGINWNRLSHPLWYDNQFQDFADGFNLANFLGGSPCLLNYKDTLYCFFISGETVRRAYFAPVTNLNERDVAPVLAITNPSWTHSGGIESPNFLSFNGKLYMYFDDYDSTGLTRRIGCAVMDMEGSIDG